MYRLHVALGSSVFIVGIRWVRCPFGRIQPFNVSQSSPHLLLLLFLLRHLLLLACSELHVISSTFGLGLCATASRCPNRRWGRRRCCRGRSSRRSHGATRPAIFEAVQSHGKMTFLREATVVDMPLFGAQSTDKFFVVRDHHDTASPIANSNCKTAESVAIQEVRRLVEHEQVRVVPARVSM